MKIFYLAVCFLSLLAEFFCLLLKDVNDISKKSRNILKAGCFINGAFFLYFAYIVISISAGIKEIIFIDLIITGIYLFLIISAFMIGYIRCL